MTCTTAPMGFLLALIMATSGCVSLSPGNASGERGSGEPSLSKPLQRTDVSLEGCFGTQMLGAVPEAWAAPFVPPEFEARQALDGTIDVFAHVMDCRRAVLPNGVVEDVIWAEFGVATFQRFNESIEGLIGVVVDTFVSSEQVHGVLKTQAIPAHLASITRTDSPNVLGAGGRGWTIAAPDSSIDILFPSAPLQNSALRGEMHRWREAETPSLTRIVYEETTTHLADFDATPIGLDGDANVNRLFGSQQTWPLVHQTRWDASYHMRIEEMNT